MWSPVESSVQIPIHKLRKISASSRHTRPKTYENLEKIEPQTSQIEARGPPKSRPEPSKALCYKDTNLRRFKSRLLYARRRHFEPTWLQVGGPRASKIEAKIEKIDIKKQHVFEIDLWVARAWFLIGFWMVFWIPNPCKKQDEEKRPRAILYCKNQYKIDVGAFATEAL